MTAQKVLLISGVCIALGMWGCWANLAIELWKGRDYGFAIPFTIILVGALCAMVAAVLA